MGEDRGCEVSEGRALLSRPQSAVHLPRADKEGSAHGKGNAASDSRKDHGHARKQRHGASAIHSQCAGESTRKARARDDVAAQGTQLTNHLTIKSQTFHCALCTVAVLLITDPCTECHVRTSFHSDCLTASCLICI